MALLVVYLSARKTSAVNFYGCSGLCVEYDCSNHLRRMEESGQSILRFVSTRSRKTEQEDERWTTSSAGWPR